MGGKINVESNFGKGSLFIVHLPQKIGSMDKQLSDTQIINTLEVKDRITSNLVDYSDKAILVVDDAPLNIKVAMKSLKPLNFKVIDTCSNGQECLDLINEGKKYDIILMDIMMPVMSGEKAMEELLKMDGFDTPVIALTADAIVGAEEKYRSEGFTDYLSKPFTKDQILYKLNRIFKSKRREELLAEAEANGQDYKSIEEAVKNKEKEANNKPYIVNIENFDEEYLLKNGIDYRQGVTLFGDLATYKDMLENWYLQKDDLLSKIKDAEETENLINYAIIVHTLKTDSKYFGFDALANLAKNHEAKARNNDKEFIVKNYEELVNELNRLFEIINNYLK
jgi:CheY-like chemotaxis protein/HPt (histidine-containing phosphotransfer) domain-containing protein